MTRLSGAGRWRARLAGLTTAAIALSTLAGAPAGAAPHTSSSAQLAPICYAVETETGNWSGAGTDGSVYIRIYGTTGTSPWFNLDIPGKYNDREAGQVDKYGCWTLPDLGTIYQIKMDYSPRSIDGDSWYLDWIAVYPDEGPASPVTWFFHYGWLSHGGEYYFYCS